MKERRRNDVRRSTIIPPASNTKILVWISVFSGLLSICNLALTMSRMTPTRHQLRQQTLASNRPHSPSQRTLLPTENEMYSVGNGWIIFQHGDLKTGQDQVRSTPSRIGTASSTGKVVGTNQRTGHGSMSNAKHEVPTLQQISGSVGAREIAALVRDGRDRSGRWEYDRRAHDISQGATETRRDEMLLPRAHQTYVSSQQAQAQTQQRQKQEQRHPRPPSVIDITPRNARHELLTQNFAEPPASFRAVRSSSIKWLSILMYTTAITTGIIMGKRLLDKVFQYDLEARERLLVYDIACTDSATPAEYGTILRTIGSSSCWSGSHLDRFDV
uniref:Uncharacterized protein n=1 Tax=Craspedostauros australis TaxID=1486917 RepID=A0A7R9WSU6_9STRA|mmetsp:Transcript_16389/g.45417  ORF Transcript_16389/g.45417 Transcript_16389/m.45417 type:complete len:329 (+) Transcript_16389:187-1173(+)|eukprot:CAMPEP_0198122930 /NCGR_PEP_ID=MMETSP1442-20131203/36197_1 /TAXON_ID= /ORGANISM="Craspedostauros australis, Strain CCMP3328" /LENGTH=328 /DNA_ID=CAMNT_0043782039 /DNA_START=93 /DNA_END=1079 /DNA_ORIENTATION=+